MQRKWTIGKANLSTVSDWRKLIRDFRDQFPYDALSALVIETFANSFDAKATIIDIQIDKDTYKILDNGKGMTQHEFEEYHNIASLTKRKGEGIGFAGVGAKIFIDRAEYIITETKSSDFHGATDWRFRGDSLEWEIINVPNKVINSTGTYIEVKIRELEDKTKLTADFIKKVLQQHYYAVLLGYYGVRIVTINGKKIEAWQNPKSEIEKRKDFDFKLGKHRVRGFFVKSKTPVPEEFQGPSIVVFGKTVQQHWFKQYPLESETFTGLVIADYLIEILTTSKTQFNRDTMLWKKFHAKIGKLFSDWLDEIGAKPKPPSVSTDMDSLARELEDSINEILKTPELRDLANRIFQNITHRDVEIRNSTGNLTGMEAEGTQSTTGTMGGGGVGGGVRTAGEEEGRRIVEDASSDTPIERVRRRVRGGIKIGWENQPDNFQEGWIDPGRQVITINMGHPAFKVAEGLSKQIRAEHVLVYHILRTVVNTMVEEVGSKDSKETTIGKMLSKWYQHFIEGC